MTTTTSAALVPAAPVFTNTERLALAVRVTDAVLARRAAFGPAITDTALASAGAAR